jgi:xylulokinase
MLVAGVDSSTQSTKVVLCQGEDGMVIGEASAPHPDGTECDPEYWWQALGRAGRGLLDRAEAIGVAAQQHGMIALDDAGQVIRPAMLWNDMRSAPQAGALVTELGGPGEWARRTGSVPTASFTVTKLRWLAENEPDNASRVRSVLLPHDWLTWRLGAAQPGAGGAGLPGTGLSGAGLSGAGLPGTGWERAGRADSFEPVTDRGDASGTGYFSPADGKWLPEIAEAALGHAVHLPRVAAPAEIVGRTPWGAALAPGTGDNMGAALGLGLREGDVVVSVGTSGTAYAITPVPVADPSGAVAGFADATGRFLPLVATVNAARVMTVTARMLGTDAEGLSDLALAAQPGAGGLTLLPYLDGERTPNRPDANGVLRGLTSANTTPENLARAAVEAVLCSLADAIDRLTECGVATPSGPAGAADRAGTVVPRRVVLIGGAARSPAIRVIAPAIFGVPVTVPEPAEYVALGAARQAAWALAGSAEPPDWPATAAADYAAEPSPQVRERYAALREDTASWHSTPA